MALDKSSLIVSEIQNLQNQNPNLIDKEQNKDMNLSMNIPPQSIRQKKLLFNNPL